MNPEQQSIARRNLKPILIVVIILLVVALAFLLWPQVKKRANTTTLSAQTSQTMAQNVQFPDTIDNGKLRFFTGSAVAELDMEKLTTRRLSKEFSIPRVVDVKWARDWVLVKSDIPAPEYGVYKSSYANQLVDQPFAWWVINISSGSVRLLNQDGTKKIQDAAWKDDNNLYIVWRDTVAQKFVVTSQTTNGSQTQTPISARDVRLVGTTSSGLITKRGTELFITRNDSSDEKIPLRTSRIPHLASDGVLTVEELVDTAATTTKENLPVRGKFTLYDTRAGKVIQDGIDNTGNASVGRGGILTLPYLLDRTVEKPKGSLSAAIYTKEGKIINLDIGEEAVLRAGSLDTVVDFSASPDSVEITFTNVAHELITLSTDASIEDRKSSFPLIPLKQPRPTLAGRPSRYDGVTNSLEVMIDPLKPVNKQIMAVVKALVDRKLDPNQIQKNWIILAEHVD